MWRVLSLLGYLDFCFGLAFLITTVSKHRDIRISDAIISEKGLNILFCDVPFLWTSLVLGTTLTS